MGKLPGECISSWYRELGLFKEMKPHLCVRSDLTRCREHEQRLYGWKGRDQVLGIRITVTFFSNSPGKLWVVLCPVSSTSSNDNTMHIETLVSHVGVIVNTSFSLTDPIWLITTSAWSHLLSSWVSWHHFFHMDTILPWSVYLFHVSALEQAFHCPLFSTSTKWRLKMWNNSF